MTESRDVVVPADLWDRVRFNADGLVPAIAQDVESREVLMMAWMDEEALRRTIAEGRVTYFSRSRLEYWCKGDTSGHTQHVSRIDPDCDGDVLLLQVHQAGAACHLGTRSCFESAV
jgi:phosphoribosyl-AMP cyclohydrolase